MDRLNKISLLQLIIMALLSGLLGSCIDEEYTGLIPADGDESTVTFSVNIPGGSTLQSGDAATRALTVEQENELNQIAVLLFDNNGYTYQPIYVSSNNITSSGQVKTFTVKVPEGTYTMVMLANANQSLSSVLASFIKGQSKADVLKQLTLSNEGKWNAKAETTGYKHIPMWGEAEVTAKKGTTVTASFTLVRMLAKIDVTLSSIAKGVFNLSSVRLYNYNSKGQVVPFDANWNNSEVTAPSIPDGDNKIATPIEYGVDAIANNGCINEIYTFEAPMGASSTHLKNTCLVVGGTYSGDSQPTFYRIDMANTIGIGASEALNYLPILRNHNYKVQIDDISGRGVSSPEEAFKNHPTNIEATVVNWSNREITDVVFDGEHILGVSAGEFTFSRKERGLTSKDNTLSVFTDHPSGWRVEKVDCTTVVNGRVWLIIPEGSKSGVAGTIANIKLDVQENTFGSTRETYIHLRAGRLAYKVKVVQYHTNDLSISIVDKDGESVSLIEFVADVGVQPDKQEFTVDWLPVFSGMSFTNTAIDNGFIFDTSGDLDNIPESGSVARRIGTKTFTIRPPAITAEDIAKDPLFSRTSHILFTVSDNDDTATRGITLRQSVRNNAAVAIPVVDNVYLMDGTKKSFGVRCNTDFTVSVTTNTGNVITKLHTVEGTPNTSAEGTRVYFEVVDDLINTHANRKEAIVTIKSPTDAFAPFDVKLNCESAIIQPESNSYIVPPGVSGILIPVSRANASDLLPQPQLAANEAFTAELVWTDNPNRISDNSNIKWIDTVGDGADGYLYVKPGLAEGNAVVAVKNKAGRILWSWHIWVTDFEPTPSSIGGFMDRNLGAIGNTPGEVGTKGLLYQWGRKDPFPGSNAIIGGNEPSLYNAVTRFIVSRVNVVSVDLNVSNNNNLANSVANPGTFYYSQTTPYDWYTDIQGEEYRNDTLWDDDKIKTIYDPCPEGWRVPMNGTWDDLNSSNFERDEINIGRIKHTHGGFYPEAGCRHAIGNFRYIGEFGYYWAATAYFAKGNLLRFSGNYVLTNSNDHRFYGFSVRCIKE